MLIQNNLIDAALKHSVERFIFLGSSCIYPRFAPQPIKEDSLLTDTLEPTNQWYALAKIVGVKACEAVKKQFGYNYISLMPTNLYGINDNFNLKTSHVLPAMIRKFHEAKLNNHATVELWGTGTPKREFLYVDDLADAVKFSLENQLSESLYNVGTGIDLSIKDLAETIQDIVGHNGKITWNTNMPDGTPRKWLDVSKLKSEGWQYTTSLKDGIEKTYHWFLKNQDTFKEVKM